MVKIIPQIDFKEDFLIQDIPSKTYKLNVERNIIEGTSDGSEAIKQTIYCILNTERFEYLIFSWDYGVELKNLIGEKSTYIVPEIERLIKEALMQDDRIKDVVDFEFTQNKEKMIVNFKVITQNEEIEVVKEVVI